MKILIALLALLLTGTGAAASIEETALTNVIDVLSAIDRHDYGRRFELRATVTSPFGLDSCGALAVTDGTGFLSMMSNSEEEISPSLSAGDVILVRGYVDYSQFSPAYARHSSHRVIERGGTPPPPPVATAKEIAQGIFDHQFVRVTGTVRDVFIDDIDPNWCALILKSGEGQINVCFSAKASCVSNIEQLVNARVSLCGLCINLAEGQRRMLGRHINAGRMRSLEVLQQSKDSLFDYPNLEDLRGIQPSEISNLSRRRVFGKVLATRNDTCFFVSYLDRGVVRVETRDGILPQYGDIIEATGFPETDLYRVNLTRAVWRRYRADNKIEPPEDITVKKLMSEKNEHQFVDISYHGRAVRLSGIVRSISSSLRGIEQFVIESEGVNVPITVDERTPIDHSLSIGCDVAVAGTCIIDVENWRPNMIFPRIKGFTIALRVPEDIRILRRPSWWTSGKLLSVAGILLAAFIGILIWNSSLRRLIEHRSRELSDETIARLGSELKVAERTRLAVELHDSIAQNLTGVSMEIRTASRLVENHEDGVRETLDLALKTVDSCRKELRNCLWDLRNLTLEESDIDDAILKTLAPHVGSTEVVVRFNVPRDRFTDNTAHAILNIIRELSINAVRHGHASRIFIAGSFENDRLIFSVRDNGDGFDVQSVPGMAQGHFGLQGIRDRINALEGDMKVESTRGKGTKVTIWLKSKS